MAGNIKLRPCRLLPIVLIFTLALAFGAGFLYWPANISREKASEIALAHVGGGLANRPHRELERFRRAWYVEVFYNGLVHSVYISVNDGSIISLEVEPW